MSQLATQSQYQMEAERPFKRPRYTRGFRNKYYNRRKNQFITRPGFFSFTRSSNRETTKNCHWYYTGNDVANSINDTAQFALNDLYNFGEIQALFDNFRITGVRYRWVLDRNPDNPSTVTANRNWNVRVVWAHDFNDSTPINLTTLMQRASLREEWLNESKNMTRWYSLKPAVLAQAYETPASTAYSPKWKQWLDTNDSSTPHYGMKFVAQNLYTGYYLRLEARISVECKGVS